MLHDNGFRVAEVSGRTGTPGVFFGCESPRTSSSPNSVEIGPWGFISVSGFELK
jgi:hypothetical protein